MMKNTPFNSSTTTPKQEPAQQGAREDHVRQAAQTSQAQSSATRATQRTTTTSSNPSTSTPATKPTDSFQPTTSLSKAPALKAASGLPAPRPQQPLDQSFTLHTLKHAMAAYVKAVDNSIGNDIQHTMQSLPDSPEKMRISWQLNAINQFKEGFAIDFSFERALTLLNHANRFQVALDERMTSKQELDPTISQTIALSQALFNAAKMEKSAVAYLQRIQTNQATTSQQLDPVAHVAVLKQLASDIAAQIHLIQVAKADLSQLGRVVDANNTRLPELRLQTTLQQIQAAIGPRAEQQVDRPQHQETPVGGPTLLRSRPIAPGRPGYEQSLAAINQLQHQQQATGGATLSRSQTIAPGKPGYEQFLASINQIHRQAQAQEAETVLPSQPIARGQTEYQRILAIMNEIRLEQQTAPLATTTAQSSAVQAEAQLLPSSLAMAKSTNVLRKAAEQAEQDLAKLGTSPIESKQLLPPPNEAHALYPIAAGQIGPRQYKLGEAHLQGRRYNQEDKSVVRAYPQSQMLIVGLFDGHGGPKTAEFAAEQLPDLLHEHLQQLPPAAQNDPSRVRLAIKDAFARQQENKTGPHTLPERQSNTLPTIHDSWQRTFSQGLEPYQQPSHGSTALIAVVWQEHVYLVNLGDSRAVLIDEQGQTKRLTLDQKPEQEQQKIEARVDEHGSPGFVSQAFIGQGLVGPQRVDGVLATARALGDNGSHVGRRPQVTVLSANELQNKTLLLGCDGIYDFVHEKDYGSHVQKGLQANKDLATIAREITNISYHRESGDNLSAMLLRLGAQ